MNKSQDQAILQLSSQVRYRAVGEDGVLVHIVNGRVLVVNEVGLYIVKLLERPMPRNELVTSIAAEFDVSREQAESDLEVYLSELDAEQVLDCTK